MQREQVALPEKPGVHQASVILAKVISQIIIINFIIWLNSMIISSKSSSLATRASASPPSSHDTAIRTSLTTISPPLGLTFVSRSRRLRVLFANYKFGILLASNDLGPSLVPTIEVPSSFIQVRRLSWSSLISMTLSLSRKSRITGSPKPRTTSVMTQSFLLLAINPIWSMLSLRGGSNNFQGKQESRATMYQPKLGRMWSRCFFSFVGCWWKRPKWWNPCGMRKAKILIK